MSQQFSTGRGTKRRSDRATNARRQPLRVAGAAWALALMLTAPVASALPAWIQRGENINGTQVTENLGSSLAASADASIIVAGAPGSNTPEDGAGQVAVFEWNGSAWVARGDRIDGGSAGDRFGQSVGINADGSIIVAGADFADLGSNTGQNAGQVRAFEWNGSAWVQRGSELNGGTGGNQFGGSVAISGDGSTIIAGAIANNEGGLGAGQVRVFVWDEDASDWLRRGPVINGAAENDGFGAHVAVSSDGLTIAASALTNDGNGDNSGHVRVFDWDADTGVWALRGAEINGSVAGDQFGDSLAISADGSAIVAAARLPDSQDVRLGQVRVFVWDAEMQEWLQRGTSIDRLSDIGLFELSAAINGNGSTIVMGDPRFGFSGGLFIAAGQVRIFDWDGSTWVQRGESINGDSVRDSDLLGTSVAINRTGSTIVASAPTFEFPNVPNFAGQLRAYDWVTRLSIEHVALPSVTTDNLAAYPVSGSCQPLGAPVSVEASDGVLRTPAVSTRCDVSGAAAFAVELDLSPLAASDIDILSTITDSEGVTASDSDSVSKTLPAALCSGQTVTLIWGAGATATSGNDVIWGTADADAINALGGDDTVCGRGGNDTINGGNGVDVIFGGEGEDDLRGQSGDDVLEGGPDADLLYGGMGDDTLLGGEGDDDLRGQGDNDTLDGGAGVDQFFGGPGDDIIITGSGGNLNTGKVVRGQGNDDTITGSSEADDLEGGPGMDEISGGDGDDLLRGGNAADTLRGEAGADTLEGAGSNDELRGGTGDDILRGGIGDDDLFGEGGDDTLDGQGGTDDCDGGSTDEILGDTATATCETVVDI